MAQLAQQVKFYLLLAILMIVVNIIGFAPSYYLKPLFEYPELPLLTHIHGLFFSAWFILFFVQVLLIKRQSRTLHRRLGYIGFILALAMIISAIQILHLRALEYDGTLESLNTSALVFSGNVVLLIMFIVFTALGYNFRKRTDWHMRFLLFSCICMMPQALGRFGRLPIPDITSAIPNEVIFGIGGMLLFILLVWLQELIQLRKIHKVSLISGPSVFIMIVLGAIALPKTEMVKNLIEWFNQ